MATRRWTDLDPRVRAAIVVAAGVDVGLRIAALVDLARRPPAAVHGSRRAWALALGLLSSAGLVPAVYFARARRPRSTPAART